MVLWHDSFWWHNKSGLIDLFISLQGFLQICIRVILIRINTGHKIMLIRLAEVFKSLFVAVTASVFTINVLNFVLTTYIVLQGVHNALDLQSRIESKFRPEFSLPLTLA